MVGSSTTTNLHLIKSFLWKLNLILILQDTNAWLCKYISKKYLFLIGFLILTVSWTLEPYTFLTRVSIPLIVVIDTIKEFNILLCFLDSLNLFAELDFILNYNYKKICIFFLTFHPPVREIEPRGTLTLKYILRPFYFLFWKRVLLPCQS